jgi:hypothetical protein
MKERKLSERELNLTKSAVAEIITRAIIDGRFDSLFYTKKERKGIKEEDMIL